MIINSNYGIVSVKHWKDQIEEFVNAKHNRDVSNDYYAKRWNQDTSNNFIKSQETLGKIGEAVAYETLKSRGIESTEPDLQVFTTSAKQHDPDLYVGATRIPTSVKTTDKRYNPRNPETLQGKILRPADDCNQLSWLLKKNDSENDKYVIFVELTGDYEGRIKYIMPVKLADLLRVKPWKETLAKTNDAIWEKHIEGFNIIKKETTMNNFSEDKLRELVKYFIINPQMTKEEANKIDLTEDDRYFLDLIRKAINFQLSEEI